MGQSPVAFNLLLLFRQKTKTIVETTPDLQFIALLGYDCRMDKVDEIEKIIEQLPPEDFAKLSLWMEQRRNFLTPITSYPQSAIQPTVFRDHTAFLASYAPEDEGIYDDAPSR